MLEVEGYEDISVNFSQISKGGQLFITVFFMGSDEGLAFSDQRFFAIVQNTNVFGLGYPPIRDTL